MQYKTPTAYLSAGRSSERRTIPCADVVDPDRTDKDPIIPKHLLFPIKDQ